MTLSFLTFDKLKETFCFCDFCGYQKKSETMTLRMIYCTNFIA